MSVPTPKTPVAGHCAAINDNTLYVYDTDAFQSLRLHENATWQTQDSGQSLDSPACVRAFPNGDDSSAALYVIGGGTDAAEYMGLQRYLFGNNSWETLFPYADVLKTRMNHSATYLNDSQSILVYGGSPSDAPSLLSSQTFLISTQEPYNIESFTSNAPPANNAILQPWNSSHAVMVGGETTNTGVWLFGPDDGWTQLGTNLSEPLDSTAKAVVVDGDDGSKVLQVYDLQVSPNTVEGIVLLDANGATAATGQTVDGASSSKKRKRELTLNNWPTYNSTNAPTSTRTDCSISQSNDGLVVVAGGNEDHPLIMFNSEENSWIDAGKFFDRQEQQPLQSSSTSVSAASTPTGTSTPSSTAAAGGSGESAHDKMLRTLGITLGTLCGIAAIFILVLLFLRWRKLKAKKKNGGYLEEKDDAPDGNRLSFADRGASFMKEAGLSATDLTPPNQDRYDANNNSHSSLAIIAGRIGNKRYTPNHGAKGSFESTTHLVKDRDGNLVPSEKYEMMGIGDKTPVPSNSNLTVPGAVARGTSLDKETRTERKRSSGWSKYFATSQPTGPNGLGHLPSVYAKPNTLSVGSEYSSDRAPSDESRIPSSALVPPLDIDFSKTVDGQRLSHVVQGSPSFFDSREDLARRGNSFDVGDGQRGVIVDPADSRVSQATSLSSFGNRSTMSSGRTSEYYHETGQVPWTPMSGNRQEHERQTSSLYTNSVYDPKDRRPSRGKSAGFFPGAGTTYKPSKIKLSHSASPTADWASPSMPMPMPPKMPAAKAPQDRDSTASNLTVFPRGVRESYYANRGKENDPSQMQQSAPGAEQPQQKPVNTDMSWLNLGLNKTQS